MDVPEFLKSHFERPVGILGFGVSGKAVAEVLERLVVPCSYVIYDKDNKVFKKESAAKHSLIVYSPGFAINHPWLILAREAGCLCLSELDFGALFWSGKIIAITGTNGKSTLTCLLAAALKNLGKSAIACGNVGSPLSAQYEYFDDEEAIAVCEVSSFQAETVSCFSPDAVIWTTFDEDHLDRHVDMREYFEAKWNLVKRLKTKELYVGRTVLDAIKEYGYEVPGEAKVVDVLDISNKELLPTGMFGALPQAENYLLGLAYWKSQGFDIKIFRKTAVEFRPLTHRLQKIAEIEGIGFWNDAKGTNFSATIAALKGFDKKVLWIGGGKMKGGDQSRFVDTISSYIEEAFLIGESAIILEERFKQLGVSVELLASLEEAVDAAFDRGKLLKEKAEIIFSPGYSSFDMFKNAEERGKFFEKKVLELKMGQKPLEVSQGL